MQVKVPFNNMEELTELFDSEVVVTLIPNDPMRKHPRFAQYKAHNNKPDQEERRRRLLEEQKKKRSELFNANRNLLKVVEENGVEDEQMDWSFSKTKNVHESLYQNKLMFSEWLVEVPQDLEEQWYLVPCPEGHRTVIVAHGNKTVALTKIGYHIATFKSLLPGGSHEGGRGSTVLDCIWSRKNHTYYILDVLFWANQSMKDCETEFRFYWLKTKFQDMPELGTCCKGNNYIFKTLPYYSCTKDVMTETMANEALFSPEGPSLDGLLFYHSKTHYIPGHTPLVGWLKPYMMPEMLGIPVAPVYLQEDMDSKPIDTERKKSRKKVQKFSYY